MSIPNHAIDGGGSMPCQAYLVRQSTKNVELISFPDTSHAFDYPDLPTIPTVVKNAYVPLCTLVEEPLGVMMKYSN